MRNPVVIINGKQGDVVSSLDRGLLYGDCLFETIAVKHGELQYWDDHLDRLVRGCEALSLKGLDSTVLKKEIQQLLSVDESQDNCIIKIIITRGVGGRGYKPGNQELTRIVQKFAWTEHPSSYVQEGVKVTLCDFRLAQQSKLSQIKHLNRLEQVLARSEWDDEFQEGLVCDHDDNVVEATSSNVFFQIKNTLITPDLSQCGVAGVMRKNIIAYCLANNLDIVIQNFKLSELNEIQAMFVCNSVNAIWPVQSYCGRKLNKTAIIEQLVAVFNS